MDDTLENAVVGGRYQLQHRLESGGMGTIWAATDTHSGSKVAVKVINEELARDSSLRERFRREAMAAAALNHPHIVRTLDFGREEDGRAWIVMEYIEGETLSDAMKREAPIAQRRVVFIAAQILDALASTHDAGIVHRDLKPPNILLSQLAGVKDAVKLMDFGIAKLMESEAYQRLTRTGQIVGTPSFMAPEQARGEEIDGRADLYALGVVMYAALANRLPYVFENNAELLVAIQDQEPTPLPEAAVAVQPELWEEVIAPALRKDPDQRFPSAHEMQAALKPFLRARTGDMEEIRAHEIAAAENQPGPAVPAPAELARAHPVDTTERHSAPPQRQLPPILLLVALFGFVLVLGMAAGVFLTLQLIVGDGETAQSVGAQGAGVNVPTAAPVKGTSNADPATPPPTFVDAGAALGAAAMEDLPREGHRRRRRTDRGAGSANDDTCPARVVLAATQSSGYTRELARAAARPHVTRAARCLTGAQPRQVMVTLNINMEGHIESATVGGPHADTEARCLESIFAHTRLPARPQVPGPLVLTLAAAGCAEDEPREGDGEPAP